MFSVEKFSLMFSVVDQRRKDLLHVWDLIKYISTIVEQLLDTKSVSLDDNFNDSIFLVFGGDKGGKHMKFHFEVVNSFRTGSVFNVHIFALYEASDCIENMAKVLLPYYRDIQKMRCENFRMCGSFFKWGF